MLTSWTLPRIILQYPYHYFHFQNTESTKGWSGHLYDVEAALLRRYAERDVLTMCNLEDARRGEGCVTERGERHPCCSGETV